MVFARKWRNPLREFRDAVGPFPLLKFAKLATGFGVAVFLCSPPLLRVNSETLLTRRASGEGRITEFVPHEFKTIAGIRPSNGSDLLIVKFSRGRHIPHGCILRRPCLFEEATLMARVFCPPLNRLTFNTALRAGC